MSPEERRGGGATGIGSCLQQLSEKEVSVWAFLTCSDQIGIIVMMGVLSTLTYRLFGGDLFTLIPMPEELGAMMLERTRLRRELKLGLSRDTKVAVCIVLLPLLAFVALFLFVGWGRRDESLLKAASRGETGWVRVRTTVGGNPNVTDRDGKTSLHHAAGKRCVTMVALLLDAGADPTLKSKKEEKTALHHAAGRGDGATVVLLLNAKADPNMESRHSLTALHLAVRRGGVPVAKPLLDHGASTNALDEKGRTPLDIAIEFKRRKLAEFLRKNGGKPGEEVRWSLGAECRW